MPLLQKDEPPPNFDSCKIWIEQKNAKECKRMDAVGIEPTTFHMQLYMQSECYAPKLSALLMENSLRFVFILLELFQIMGEMLDRYCSRREEGSESNDR
jgi:hypothetical protein